MAKVKILAQNRHIALGLNVDGNAAAGVALDLTYGEILFRERVAHRLEDRQNLLAHFPDCTLWACYEAGGWGFHLCRLLRELGVDCQVVAPSQVPKSANAQQLKTDHRDALMLAQLYFHPPRSFVRIPTESEERDRQLVRTREQMLRDRNRTQTRIKSLLAFHSIAWSRAETPGFWSKQHRETLRQMPLPDPLRPCLDALLDLLEQLDLQIRQLNRQIVALSQTEPYHDRCARLRQIHGVGLLTAMTFLTETFRPADFPTAEAFACHVGFTPCEWSSASRRRQGHITHWGPSVLRRMLIEATWSWVRKDAQAAACFLRISGGSQSRKRAFVGMARRLSIILWAMTVREEDYAYRWSVAA